MYVYGHIHIYLFILKYVCLYNPRSTQSAFTSLSASGIFIIQLVYVTLLYIHKYIGI